MGDVQFNFSNENKIKLNTNVIKNDNRVSRLLTDSLIRGNIYKIKQNMGWCIERLLCAICLLWEKSSVLVLCLNLFQYGIVKDYFHKWIRGI